MPVVTITLIEGYDEATREALERRLTHAVQATIAAPLDGITVIVNEVVAANYMRGGVRRLPGAPQPGGAELVRGFLAAMEARELERARGFLAEDFVMTYPGEVRFETLDQFVAWAEGRSHSVAKTYERFDEAPAEDGLVVYCHGTLAGRWPDGSDFAGIRFIDRFTVRGGKLADQQVWNDLAEAR